MNNNYTIKDYILETNKINIKSFNFILLSLIFLIGGIFLLSKFNYYEYKKILIVEENNIFKTTINIEDIEQIMNKKTIVINNKKYSYKVIRIEKEIMINNDSYLKTLHLKVNNYKGKYLENKIIEGNIVINKTNSLKQIIKFVQGGTT